MADLPTDEELQTIFESAVARAGGGWIPAGRAAKSAVTGWRALHEAGRQRGRRQAAAAIRATSASWPNPEGISSVEHFARIAEGEPDAH